MGGRVDEQQAAARVLGQVARRLREELVRQRDALVVDDVGLRQVGDVGHAGRRRGGEHGRDGALEARREVGEREAASGSSRSRVPHGRRQPRAGARAGRLVVELVDVDRAARRRSAGTRRSMSLAAMPSSSTSRRRRRRSGGRARFRSSAVTSARPRRAVPFTCTERRVRTSAPVTAIGDARQVAAIGARAVASHRPRTSTRIRAGRRVEHLDAPAPGGEGLAVGAHEPDDRGATRLEEGRHVGVEHRSSSPARGRKFLAFAYEPFRSGLGGFLTMASPADPKGIDMTITEHPPRPASSWSPSTSTRTSTRASAPSCSPSSSGRASRPQRPLRPRRAGAHVAASSPSSRCTPSTRTPPSCPTSRRTCPRGRADRQRPRRLRPAGASPSSTWPPTAADAAGPDQRRLVHQLYLDLAAFTSSYLAHQDLEERVLMPARRGAIGFEAVLGMHQAIVGAHPARRRWPGRSPSCSRP